MEKIKLLHTADIHIGAAESFLGFSADKRRFETLLTFEKIMDLAISEKVDIVALAGDIFDSNQIENHFIDAVFEKIAKASPIKVIFSAGNHDPLDATSPFLNRNLPENLYVLDTKDQCLTFEDIKTKVYGRSFAETYLKGEELFTIKPDNNYISLMVQHGELKSDLSSDYNSITPKFVKNSGMDYIALGHIHKRSEIGRIDNTHFAYCGCPEGQGFDELDQKGILIGHIGKGLCELEFVPVSKRQHIHAKIKLEGALKTEEIIAKVLCELSQKYGDSYKENLYKIELTGEISADSILNFEELLSRLSNELYFVKLKDNTELAINPEDYANEQSLKGIFVRKMLSRAETEPDKKHLYQKALKLGLKAFEGEVKYNED